MILDYIHVHVEKDVILSRFNYKLYIYKRNLDIRYVRIEILEIKRSEKFDI